MITEVLDTRDVELVSRHADILQVGTRNMQNYALLDEVGQARMPVLLKRGFSATYEDWLLAAEYILSRGNKQLMLCERGIRDLRDLYPQHPGHHRHPGHPAAEPSPHHRRPKPRHRQVVPGYARGPGRRRRRCRRPAYRGTTLIRMSPLSDGAQSLTFENFQKLMFLVTAIRKATEEVASAW